MASKKPNATPLLRILIPASALRDAIKPGMNAVSPAHRQAHFDDTVKPCFSDSLDIDAAFAQSHPNANRWDYLLSHAPSNSVIAVEPHSAKTAQVRVVIAKKDKAKEQLSKHLVASARIAKWLWVGSGKNGFADTDKARRQLDQKGIEFVSPKIMLKHF